MIDEERKIAFVREQLCHDRSVRTRAHLRYKDVRDKLEAAAKDAKKSRLAKEVRKIDKKVQNKNTKGSEIYDANCNQLPASVYDELECYNERTGAKSSQPRKNSSAKWKFKVAAWRRNQRCSWGNMKLRKLAKDYEIKISPREAKQKKQLADGAEGGPVPKTPKL